MASAQSEDVQQQLDSFLHHDKPEHPPTDIEAGKKPADEEHKETQGEEKHQHPLMQSKERRVKDAQKQADQYGREMIYPQTLPQTVLNEQDPFGAPADSAEGREPREKISLFPSAED